MRKFNLYTWLVLLIKRRLYNNIWYFLNLHRHTKIIPERFFLIYKWKVDCERYNPRPKLLKASSKLYPRGRNTGQINKGMHQENWSTILKEQPSPMRVYETSRWAIVEEAHLSDKHHLEMLSERVLQYLNSIYKGFVAGWTLFIPMSRTGQQPSAALFFRLIML